MENQEKNILERKYKILKDELKLNEEMSRTANREKWDELFYERVETRNKIKKVEITLDILSNPKILKNWEKKLKI